MVAASNPAIVCKDLELRRDGRQVLSVPDWSVNPGERWIVMGPNGCGKSSLALAILGRLAPWEGSIEILGRRSGLDEIISLRTRIGFTGDALEPLVDRATTAAELVETGFVGTLGLRFERPTRVQKARSREELAAWGLAEFLKRPLGTLSLGQRRRAWLARALAPEPDLLVLDEPCAGLDPAAREELIDHLDALSKRRPTLPMVLVTHHVEEIPSSFTHALTLADGQAKKHGPLRTVLSSSSLETLFGRPFRIRWKSARASLERLP
jgi:iron complex transport system ATP-binding protein